jgi:RNA polymerase sigma-70 factor (ECF subfamily)
VEDVPFSHLAHALRARDEDAARLIFERFAGQLIRLAAAHLPPRLAGKTDAESAVQSAFGSFFAGHAEGRYDLTDWDGLWGLLAVITVRKCGHRLERFGAKKRDVSRESPLAGRRDGGDFPEPVAPTPTPAEVLLFKETVQELFSRLAPGDHQVVLLRMDGHEVRSIADQTGRSERTVARVLAEARAVLERLTGPDRDPVPTDRP